MDLSTKNVSVDKVTDEEMEVTTVSSIIAKMESAQSFDSQLVDAALEIDTITSRVVRVKNQLRMYMTKLETMQRAGSFYERRVASVMGRLSAIRAELIDIASHVAPSGGLPVVCEDKMTGIKNELLNLDADVESFSNMKKEGAL